MCFLSHCSQSSFPPWESQPTSPPSDALQHHAGLWTCCGGSSGSNLVLLQCVLASNVHSCQNWCVFSCGSSQWPFIFHRHRVCLVDHMDLICSLYGWREGFGSFSLATLPLGLNCGFISTSACESSPGVCFWGCPGGPGLAPVRAGCGGGAAAWVAGVLTAPGAQGGWRQGQQKIWCARRAWQPVLANTLQYSCLENPSLTEKPGRPQCKGLQRVEHDQSDPACTDARLSPVSALPQRELSVKVAQLLGFRGPWWHRVCRDTAGLHCRGHGPIRVLSLS